MTFGFEGIGEGAGVEPPPPPHAATVRHNPAVTARILILAVIIAGLRRLPSRDAPSSAALLTMIFPLRLAFVSSNIVDPTRPRRRQRVGHPSLAAPSMFQRVDRRAVGVVRMRIRRHLMIAEWLLTNITLSPG